MLFKTKKIVDRINEQSAKSLGGIAVKLDPSRIIMQRLEIQLLNVKLFDEIVLEYVFEVQRQNLMTLELGLVFATLDVDIFLLIFGDVL